MEVYESVAKILQQKIGAGGEPSWLDLATLRYNLWQRLGDPQQFREFQSYPFGRMILKSNLPSLFASMPAEEKEYLREAEIRVAQFHIVCDGTIKTHAAVLADIRKNVHSSTRAKPVRWEKTPTPELLLSSGRSTSSRGSQWCKCDSR